MFGGSVLYGSVGIEISCTTYVCGRILIKLDAQDGRCRAGINQIELYSQVCSPLDFAFDVVTIAEEGVPVCERLLLVLA